MKLLIQVIMESKRLSALALSVLAMLGKFLYLIGMKGWAIKLLSQAHRTSDSETFRLTLEPAIFANLKLYSSRPHPIAGEDLTTCFGNRILVLKRKVSNEEKGVLLIKFSELLPRVAANFDMDRLLADYTLVFEPSWSGYCDKDFLHYTTYQDPIYFLAAEAGDFAFLERLESNLKPVPLGPCDWVNPSIAEQFLGSEKQYDIVFNSNWGNWKRHFVLFRTLTELSSDLKVALVGFPWRGQTHLDIEKLAKRYGVRDQLTFFDRISFEEVMHINCQSKMALLLSLKEGSNRAISESFFCDIPAIVLEEHVGGIKKNIVPETGQLSREVDLAKNISNMLENLSDYAPREWAIRNIACNQSTAVLNEQLKKAASRDGAQWTIDIAERSNAPELGYVHTADADQLMPITKSLDCYLR